MKEEFDFYSKTNINSYNLNESMRYQLGLLDSLDAFTRKHCENVANLTCRLCEYLHLNKGFIIYCTTCAYLHDVGKMFIPPEVLQKPGALTDEEYKIMQKHAVLGYKLCMEDPKLREYSAGAKFHHEALNGTGYPEGLTKKDIPLEGQIIRVADEYDAIVSKRQYKSHVGISDTLKMLIEEAEPNNPKKPRSGKMNPKVVSALLKVVIDDIIYEINCVYDYVKYLEEQIDRLNQIDKYKTKYDKTNRQSQKEYIELCMKSLFKDTENVENYKDVLEEYKVAYEKRKEIIDNLMKEMKIIKKLRV